MEKPDDIMAHATAEAMAEATQPVVDGVAREVPVPPPPGAVPNLRKAALTGAMWIAGGYGFMYLLRMVAGAVQTYLVDPNVFGLIATALVFIQGLHMFSDVGIGLSAIQSKRGDEPAFLNTAWTLQVLRGLILWAATWVIAWPVADFWGEPMLMYLIPVSGATAAIDGFNSTSLFLLARRLGRGPLVALEVTVQTTGILLTLAWMVWVNPLLGLQPNDKEAVWAFVVGQLGTSLLNMTLTHVALPGHRSRFRWEPAAVQELLHFGKWVFFGTAITFFAFQADPLIVSRIAGLTLFGVFNRALTLAGIATGLMSMFATQLVFPVYSRMHQQGRDIRTNFRKVHTGAAAVAALLVSGLLASGPEAILFMYGKAFHAAAWMLPFVAVGAWFQMLEGTTGASLLTLGQARSVTISNAARLIGVLVFVPLGYFLGNMAGLESVLDPEVQQDLELYRDQVSAGGFIGMLLGFIAADFSRYLVVVWLARLNGMSAVTSDLTMSLLIVLISLAAWFAGAWLGGLGSGSIANRKVQSLMVFLAQGILVVLMWGLVYLVWLRGKLGRAPLPA